MCQAGSGCRLAANISNARCGKPHGDGGYKPDTSPVIQEAVVRELVHRIGDKTWDVSEGAIIEAAKLIEAQGAHADMAVFEPLIEPLFKHANWGGMGRREGKAAADALVRIGQTAVPMLLENLTSMEGHDRWSALDILGRISEPKAVVLSQARGLLRDPDEYVRRTAIEILGKMGPDALPAVPELLQQEAVEKVLLDRQNMMTEYEFRQVWIQMALIRIQGPNADRIRALASHLKCQDESTARFAAENLGDIGAPAHIVLPELLEALHSTNANTRVGAAGAIGQIGADDDKTIAALIDRLKNDPELYVRQAAASSLGDIGPKAKAALPALRQAAYSGPESEWWGWGDAIQHIEPYAASTRAAATQTAPAPRPAGEIKPGAWWEAQSGWAQEVNGLRVRIDISGVNAPRLGMAVGLMFWNVSEGAFALNLSDGTMRRWEVRDAWEKIVEPRATMPAVARGDWTIYIRAQSTPYIPNSPRETNQSGHLEIDGRTWQLPPGRYTLRATFSGPSKVAGKLASTGAWEGSVEVPAQTFEVFGEPTPEAFQAAIAKTRARILITRRPNGGRWRNW